ncbi:hypothetical protein KB57_184 [Klebsiella phage vB_KpnM_KB57]|uniref:Uncharacterized protein n=1 Tax=Klebsiella phage vB_KpnM_KB57 TaxID=1719140 RepID=A0A0S1S1D6_9CAUD|nr:hypothetical protein KB57_184 [Klebsiella phage vB_KpnM_KB57]ALM02571.1 hypothetical protein KB57_184 [Klebsiella phage vB_KpnM_KB57]
MDDTGFLLLGMLITAFLILIPYGMMLYVSIGPVAKKDDC